MPPPMITGLYPYARGGVVYPPKITLSEIPVSLVTNEAYRDDLLVLAGDDASAAQLEGFGLHVHRVFSDAPAFIQYDAAHKNETLDVPMGVKGIWRVLVGGLGRRSSSPSR